jgi:hypothetical protein
MMPIVRIPENVFARLQKHAEPFVDTPVNVIERLLDFYERGRRPSAAGKRPTEVEVGPSAKAYNPNKPPDLTHTILVSAEFDGTPTMNWNDLVEVAHRRAAERYPTYDELRAATQSNIVRGEKTDKGFRHLGDIDVSIQGVGAGAAWRKALHLAQRLGVHIRAEFEWRDKRGAVHPGKRGYLEWTPAH